MAEAAPARDKGRVPRWLCVGCAAGCGLVLLAFVVIGVIALRGGWDLMGKVGESAQAIEGFVAAAAGGQVDAAYEQLHPEAKARITAERFAADWSDLTETIGAYRSLTPGPPAMDIQRSVLRFPVTITGDRGTAQVKLDINPNDAPVRVLGYEFEGGPSGGGEPPAGEEPGKAPAT